MFIDHIRIFGKAGDGGAGGDIILVVDNSVDNLRAYHYDPKLVAEDGKRRGWPQDRQKWQARDRQGSSWDGRFPQQRRDRAGGRRV